MRGRGASVTQSFPALPMRLFGFASVTGAQRQLLLPIALTHPFWCPEAPSARVTPMRPTRDEPHAPPIVPSRSGSIGAPGATARARQRSRHAAHLNRTLVSNEPAPSYRTRGRSEPGRMALHAIQRRRRQTILPVPALPASPPVDRTASPVRVPCDDALLCDEWRHKHRKQTELLHVT